MNDDNYKALAHAIDVEHNKLVMHSKKVLVYGDISTVDEVTLDALANDIKVKYFNTELSYNTKLELFKENVFRSKFTIGTAKTVSKIVGIVFGDAKVIEWFDTTKLDPFEFIIRIIASKTGFTLKSIDEAIRMVVDYKNVRSHLKYLQLALTQKGNLSVSSHLNTGMTIEVMPLMVKEIKAKAKLQPIAFIKAGQRFTIHKKAQVN